jgi:hypothetical protein
VAGEAVQPPTTTAEIALFGGWFGDDASAAPTMATTHPVPSTNTSNHRTVAPGPLCDGTVAAGLQSKQSQPPFPRRIDAPSRFGVLVTSAAPTTATTPLFSLFTACNAHPITAGHLGDGIGASGAANKAVWLPVTAAEVADTLQQPLPPSPPPLLQPAEPSYTSSVGRPIAAKPHDGGEMVARVVLETTWPSDTNRGGGSSTKFVNLRKSRNGGHPHLQLQCRRGRWRWYIRRQ